MFEAIFFGHFIGDYLFQTDWMAVNKQAKTWRGMWACLLHSLTYSLTVLLALFLIGKFSWQIFIIIFLSHYPIDRYALGNKWMKMMGITTPEDLFKIDDFALRERRKMFIPLVAVVIDNILHLVIMWIALNLI